MSATILDMDPGRYPLHWSTANNDDARQWQYWGHHEPAVLRCDHLCTPADHADNRAPRHWLGWAEFDAETGDLVRVGQPPWCDPLPIELEVACAEARQIAAMWHGRWREYQTPVYVRFGDPPKSGRSVNHADGRAEKGVSCVELRYNLFTQRLEVQWTNPLLGSLASILHRPCYLVHGKLVGYGSDGEPLLADVKVLRRINGRQCFNPRGCTLDELYA